MFPFPNKITGDKQSLINSYNTQIKNIKTKNIPDNKGNFRFCSYNVKFLEYNNYNSNNIKQFIDNINADAFSLIEYDGSSDLDFKIQGNSSILFEQLKDYGIFTTYNTQQDKSSYILQKYRCLSHDRYGHMGEVRGFTHTTKKERGSTINIISVHLDVYDETGEIRLLEIQDIYDYIIKKKLKNVFILGDFNEWVCKKGDPTYESSLEDFQCRTGLDHFSSRVHEFLKSKNFSNVFTLKNKDPKFSCWSGKLVDFCYVFDTTFDKRVKIVDIHMPLIPYSDHLPIVLDLNFE